MLKKQKMPIKIGDTVTIRLTWTWLTAQNTNILKKILKNLKKLRTKASITRSKSYCWV
jgi:hypothetical protein